MHDAIAIIPARMGSTRFPGKVLADETGHPLIWHVHERARAAECVSRIVIATDSNEVLEAVEAFNGEVVLTSTEHPNGASRLGEACELLGLRDDAIVVNVQGDEPELDPDLIDAAVVTLIRTGAPVATVASPFGAGEDPSSPHLVKVVRRTDGSALYFSRSLIPHAREASPDAAPLRHVGLYVYRRSFLRTYGTLAPTPLEQAEALEQLRILEHGFTIAVAEREAAHHGVDTPDDYRAFVERWRAGGAGSAAGA